MLAFKDHPSYVPLDMNEPEQLGPDWEPIAAGRVAALRSAGWDGIIGVSAGARSSAGGINNATNGHPGGWWITDTRAFLEVHHYLQHLNDGSVQTRAQLDALAAGSGRGVSTYLQFIDRTFPDGLFGNAIWNDVPVFVGETSMPPGMEAEMHALLRLYDARGVGVCWWADWTANPTSTYAWRMNNAQRAVLTAHTNPPAPLERVRWRGTTTNQAGMLALTTAVPGDWTFRTDVNARFDLTGPDPSVLANWRQVSSIPDDSYGRVVRWSGGAWGARPVGAGFGVFFLSTNDVAAPDPPTLNRLAGDMWIRHPDAAPLT